MNSFDNSDISFKNKIHLMMIGIFILFILAIFSSCCFISVIKNIPHTNEGILEKSIEDIIYEESKIHNHYDL